MDLLDHADAQRLLQDAELDADTLHDCAWRLHAFAQRYLPLFARREQRDHALVVLQGKFTTRGRKTTEPIARQARRDRRPLQLFVGAARWDDRALRTELRRQVAEEIGDDRGTFILDSSGFPKKGTESCGVGRQWCGRLGKLDNCQVGVFLAYAAPRGKALLDARLYLPDAWAADRRRRLKTHVPAAVAFAEKWRLALGLLDEARSGLAGSWVVGDDAFGRCAALRSALRLRRLHYVLDVPCNTLVRDPAERRPPARPGGRARRPVFQRVDQWLARQPAGRWRAVGVRDGAKGPVRVKVLLATVQVKDEDGGVGGRERLVVLKSCEPKPQTWYALSNDREADRGELARRHGARHRVEELLEEGKGEVGLAEYEVRSWVGWHHHLTLTLLALWFLQWERLRLGEKNAGVDGATSAGDHGRALAGAGGQRGAGGGGGERGAAA